MRIAGYNPNSFVDYPSLISAVIFVEGCNLDCAYCHNKHIIKGTEDVLNTEDVLSRIKLRKTFLDAVVISGGEPSIADRVGLFNLIAEIKKLGLKVKIDTNGTDAEFVRAIIPRVDFIAMDIKAPLGKYHLVTPITARDLRNIEESISLLLAFPNSEFRTTFIPELTAQDVADIAQKIKTAPRFVLQKYNPVDGHNLPPHTKEEFQEALAEAKKIKPNTTSRGA